MSSPGPVTEARPTKPRCLTCKRRKVKCTGGPEPCENCRRLSLSCTFTYSEASVTPVMGDPHALVPPSETLTEAGTRRRRIAAACMECRNQKANLACVYPSSSSSSSSQSKRKNRQAGQQQQQQQQQQHHHHHHHQQQQHPQQSQQWTSPESISSTVVSRSAPCEAGSRLQRTRSSLNTALDHSLLSTDVVRQHLEAYFDHVYPIGHDFFHRPSMMEEFYAGRLPPILCTSVCATAAMFVSRSRESRVLSVQWAKEVEAYIFANLNVFKVLNIQLVILSMFQNFAYRQFGKMWLMIGMAARLAVSFQLNDERRHPHHPPDNDTATLIKRECERRLVWHVWIMDKMLSAGLDEFTALPNRWMRVSLPNSEHAFCHGLLKPTSKLDDGVEALASHEAGPNSYLIMLLPLWCEVLKSTKGIVLDSLSDSSPAAVAKAVAVVKDLQQRLINFLGNMPKHLRLSELNMFSHSTTSEFSSYLTLNSWYLQCCSDLYRVALPAPYRESAAPGFLANAPPDLVAEWRALAVSHALRQARLWEHVQNLRAKGALQSKQTRIPLRLGYGSMVHQCTKTLLTARRCRLYDGLTDPVTGDAVGLLDDDTVQALCRSNVALLDEMARIAPVVAVLQQDVKKMVEADDGDRRRQDGAEAQEHDDAPVSSEVQRSNLLSRYHPLSQSFDSNAETADEVALQHSDPPPPQPSSARASHTSPAYVEMAELAGGGGQAPEDIYPASLASAAGLNDIGSAFDGPLTWSGFAENQLASDYFVAPSQFDMSGELSWFLSGYMDPDPAASV
ncbi:putative transcriptional regulatory protein [Colletotrichum shisoi]|uniref:Putative transcriptional regulatory protein n=1 Tax=Colletotrichum shisoi TaxID=2078593 RepID=A0A5Q4BEX6_9PEZI|nr:putative transcriptional regulatory protein [Colletotrichum shisoi]